MSDVEDVIGDCAVYENGTRSGGRVTLAGARSALRTTSGFVWVGLQQPSEQDLATVARELDLPPLAVEDAVKAHQRPKLEVYDDVMFVVLRPVRYVDSDEIVEVEEISVFLGKHFIVTVRHGSSSVLGQVRRELDQGTLPSKLEGPIAILHRAADLIVDQYMDVTDFLDDDVAEIEAQVFAAREGDHAERIYKLKREVLEFRRAVLPLAEPMYRLANSSVTGIAPESAQYFRDVHDHVLRAADAIEGYDRLLSDILQANLARVGVQHSAVAVQQNADMRRISAWAAIALVPTAIAGIYGMNFQNMPELEWRYGYFVTVSVIGAVCGTLYISFKRNGWL